MDFTLTEEQALIKQSVREFIAASEGATVREILQSLAEIDCMGIFLEEQVGGAGGDFTSYILALEEIAMYSPSAALAYSIQNTQVAYAITQFGCDEAKKTYLPQLCKGEALGAYAYSEQGIGEDLLTIETNAVKTPDGFVLNGTKTFVLGGGESDFYLVFAQQDIGLSAFLVDAEAKGVSFEAPYRKMGLDGVNASTMKLVNVHVLPHQLLGEGGKGIEIHEEVRNLHNISLAAIATGISQKAIDQSISYGKERVQFKKPIIKFDALREKIGVMAANIEAARLLTYKAAVSKNNREPISEISTIAKYFAVKTGEDHVREAIQIHGGYGYTKDLGIESLYRDMKGLHMIESLEKPLVYTIADQKIG